MGWVIASLKSQAREEPRFRRSLSLFSLLETIWCLYGAIRALLECLGLAGSPLDPHKDSGSLEGLMSELAESGTQP